MASGTRGARTKPTDGRAKARTPAQKEHWQNVLKQRRQLLERLRALEESEAANGDFASESNDEQDSEPEAPAPAPPAKKAKPQPAPQASGGNEALFRAIAQLIQTEVRKAAVGPGPAQDLPEGASAGGGFQPIDEAASHVPLPADAFNAPSDGGPDTPQFVQPQRIERGDAAAGSNAPARTPHSSNPYDIADIVGVSKVARLIAQRGSKVEDVRRRMDALLEQASKITGRSTVAASHRTNEIATGSQIASRAVQERSSNEAERERLIGGGGQQDTLFG